jgi:hypothetical protein
MEVRGTKEAFFPRSGKKSIAASVEGRGDHHVTNLAKVDTDGEVIFVED